MGKHEKQLTAKFLELAAGEFSNHGCNDVDEDFFEGWTKDQRQEFCKEWHEWNGDPDEYDPEWLSLPDYAIMDFLASKIRSEL